MLSTHFSDEFYTVVSLTATQSCGITERVCSYALEKAKYTVCYPEALFVFLTL